MNQIGQIFSDAWSDFRRVWPKLLVADALCSLAAVVLLTPIVGPSLRAFLSISGNSVLADQDILLFVLSPIGVVALVAIAAASITVVVVEQACLTTIAFGVVRGVRVRVVEALWVAARRLGSILLIAARLVVRVLLLAAPFLAACGLTYTYLLTEFDINFYLTNRPPVFWVAATLIGVLLLVLAALLLPRLLGWTYALPLHLFEGVGAARALGTSEERTREHRLSLAAALVGWFALSTVLSAVALGVVGTLGRFLVPRFQGSMAPLLFVMGGLSLMWAVVNLVVTLIQTSTFALLVVRLYERHGGAAGAKLPDDMSEVLGAGVALNLSFKKLLAGLAVASAVAGLVGYSLIAGVRMDDDVLVIAHRGAAGRAPENTLASVEAAIEDEADLVEIDVQETRDGRVVVIHDSDFKKIAGSGVKIWEADFDEVRQLDIGSWFAPEFHAERVPTLEEVLDVAKGRARVNIELKYYGHDDRLEERVVQIVEEMGMASDVVLMSLKLDAIRKLRALRPGWTVGLLSATAVGDLTRVDADFLAVHTGLATPRFVRRAHAAGKRVYVWTVNDPVNMFWMISRGVDGVITDEPALGRTVLTRRADMTASERLLLEAAFWLGAVPNEPPPESDV